MSAITIQPPAPPAIGLEPPRRERRWILAAVAASLLAASLIGGVSYITTYQPLVAGSVGIGPMFEDLTLKPPGLSANKLPYVPGANVRWGFSVRNGGHFPVTVERIEWSQGAGPLQDVVFLVAVHDFPSRSVPGRLEPMRGLTLPPGAERVIVLEARLGGCVVGPTTRGGGSNRVSVTGLTLDYSALGIAHKTAIDAGEIVNPLVVAVPSPAIC